MLTVLAGAYDGTLHGWQGQLNDLQLSFAFRAHESCIRSVVAHGKIACSAASDESIQVYDLVKKKVLDRMSGVHEDEVTALGIAKSATNELFLLSGDGKGKIFVWTMKDRKVIHELKGHKQTSAVTTIAVHPSGRVALSTAKDNSIRLWDLVNAKAAPRTKLDKFKIVNNVCWSPNDGAHYAVVGDDTTVLIFDAITGAEKPLGTFIHPKRVNALRFVEDVVLASACDDGKLRILGADGSLVREFGTENPCRVRDVASISRIKSSSTNEEDEDDIESIVAGVFSDGTIRLWDLNQDDDEPVASLNVGTAAHMTCVCMSWLDSPAPIIANENNETKKSRKSKRQKPIDSTTTTTTS